MFTNPASDLTAGNIAHPCISVSGVFYSLALFILSVLPPFEAKSQGPAEDSAFYVEVINNLDNLYEREIGPNSGLYDGKEYLRFGRKTRGFPFFTSDSLSEGSVFYNGRLYSDIKLQYDLVNQEVIIHNYPKTGFIQLVNEKIAYFILYGHFFRKITPSNINPSEAPEGFYDEVYNEGLKVFVNRKKKLRFAGIAGENQANYDQTDSYFLLVNGNFFKITGKKSVLAAMKDKKELVKKYIKKNNISFQKSPEEALIRIAGYYHQIEK